MPRLLPLAMLSLLLLGADVCPSAPEIFLLVVPENATTWQRFEVRGFVRHADDANPFDPAEIQLVGEFEDPQGGLHVMPGFATREYERELVGGFEKRRPTSSLFWAVRFSPSEAGVWRWRWVVTMPGQQSASAWRTLTVAPPAPQEHGILRVSDEDPRYLAFEDGAPFFAVGENMGWYDGRGSFAYEDWLDALAAEGGNYIRVWMPSWAFGIEWDTLGDYSQRLDRAWALDRVLEAAEARGIYVMLTIQNHGPFSLDSNSQWTENPYNAANGGPLTDPKDFFDDPESLRLFRQRLRYVVARWGYSTHLLAWELWNEVNLAVSPASPEMIAWHSAMADELDRLDPYDHLVTTSTALNTITPLWTLPEIDFTQTHAYAWPFFLDFPSALPFLMNTARVAGKPTLLAEVGTDFRGPAETLAGDPEAIGFHDALWTGVMAEAFGTGMTWWWDNLIDPEGLYFHFGAVARFVEGVAFHREGFVASQPEVISTRELAGYALTGSETVLVWIKNTAHQWFPDGISGDPLPVTDAELSLVGVPAGRWSATWLDTQSGDALSLGDVVISDGSASLEAPDFVGDIALRLDRDLQE